MLIVLGIVLALSFAAAAMLGRAPARRILIQVSVLFLLVGFVMFALLSWGPSDLWMRLPWLPHPWLMGGFGVISIALGGSVLLGIGTRAALGMWRMGRDR